MECGTPFNDLRKANSKESIKKGIMAEFEGDLDKYIRYMPRSAAIGVTYNFKYISHNCVKQK